MNSVNIVGRLTKEPAPRKTQNGNTNLQICVAVERGDKNKNTDFIDCVAWGSRAEFISKYFHKGTPIAITGSLQTRVWEKNDGTKQKITEVFINEAGFVPRQERTEEEDIEGGDEENVAF
jgi:single-strand DNA-binding protein